MAKKIYEPVTATLTTIVGGGQTLGTLDDGRKLFVWGGLPGEKVVAQITRKKSNFLEGVVTEVVEPSAERIAPKDAESYISTSPWQIMTFEAEQKYKSQLITEAFQLHRTTLPSVPEMYTNNEQFEYRNKIEFSFWYDVDKRTLSLAFFQRGSHGKIAVDGTSLAHPSINTKAREILSVLNAMHADGRTIKTLLIRCDALGNTAWQLYIKDEAFDTESFMEQFDDLEKGEVIFSNPRSPASVITKRLMPAAKALTDTILNVPFRYATEGFFQINLPVYQQALEDMKAFIPAKKPVVDLYSGVGTIGLTIGGPDVTLIEVNEHAVREMEQNIADLGSSATALLAPSEKALEHITSDRTIIVDPPRAGLHDDVVARLLEALPERIIYLSCNPVTQARDVEMLNEKYAITHHRGYNFFPRTPHIEHLVILDLKD